MTKTLQQTELVSNGKWRKWMFDDGTEGLSGADRDSQFSAPIEAGVTAECVVTTRENKSKPGEFTNWVEQWGEKKSKQFGGGGKQWQPKSASEIATMEVCNVNTTTVTALGQLVAFGAVKDLAGYTAAYKAVHAVVLAETVEAHTKMKVACE